MLVCEYVPLWLLILSFFLGELESLLSGDCSDYPLCAPLTTSEHLCAFKKGSACWVTTAPFYFPDLRAPTQLKNMKLLTCLLDSVLRIQLARVFY